MLTRRKKKKEKRNQLGQFLRMSLNAQSNIDTCVFRRRNLVAIRISVLNGFRFYLKNVNPIYILCFILKTELRVYVLLINHSRVVYIKVPIVC